MTTQTFRDLFRSEVIRGHEGLGVKDIALLFTDLKGSTALYDRIGDLNAFSLVQQHFDRLQSVTVRHNGAIIKTIGDAVMAAFLNPADAVQAALDMRSEIASFNERQPDRRALERHREVGGSIPLGSTSLWLCFQKLRLGPLSKDCCRNLRCHNRVTPETSYGDHS